MAKIAVTRDAGKKFRPPTVRALASGEGWAVSDVVCRAGPRDPPFEEQHCRTSIAFVVEGTFQYLTTTGNQLMVPGSLLLGDAGDCFRCGHEHGAGDRCVSFSYDPALFERLSEEAGAVGRRFRFPRLPPIPALAPLAARACALLDTADGEAAEEIGIELAGMAARLGRGAPERASSPDAAALARITRVVRMIECDPEAPCDLATLSALARLSRYHFLRTFAGLTGVTPRQFVLRTRLRRAASRLRNGEAKVAEIALGCGFGDVSNFNRTFRGEFGMSPRAYRAGRISGAPPARNPRGPRPGGRGSV